MASVKADRPKRRAVIYARVSKLPRDVGSRPGAERVEGKSVDQQIAELTAIADREAVEIVAVRRDDGVSASRYGARRSREGWREVMAAIADDIVDELWVWEISRATRDRPVWAALVSACLAHDVKISVGGKLHDPHDPDDGFMLDLGAALAVRESAMNSKRICRDVAARAAQGLPHGKIPYGYRRIYDSRTRALIRQEPDPETAPIVRELARRVLAGEAFYALTHELNARGIPSPETIRMRRLGNTTACWAWRPDQVRDVVLSPTSAGRRLHRGIVLAGVNASWEPLISESDHALLVERLCDPSRRSWKDGGVKHLLTFLAHCGVCGAPVRRIVNRDKYANYSCSGGPGKFCVARKQQWVDNYVTDVVIERLSQPDALDVYATENAGLQQARQSLVAHEAELSTLRAAKKDGRISLQAFLDFEPIS
jgi:DNA invertase Pin-like site-specific DNA recombinase